MSWLVRWWSHRNLSSVLPPKTLGAVLTAAVLLTVLGAVAAEPPRRSGPAGAAGAAGAAAPTVPASPTPAAAPVPPPTWPAPSPAPTVPVPEATTDRPSPKPNGVAPRASPPRWPADPAGDFVGWALLASSEAMWYVASDNGDERSTTASMIKVWIAADYLRRLDEAGQVPSRTRLDQLTEVIRDSDNEYAQEIFAELGAHKSIERLIDICDLPYARAFPYRWSNTQLSPIDAVFMGTCIADGRAAGPEWTDWLLEEMRQVRGLGDFGIRDVLPAGEQPKIAIKNGWVERTEQEEWHVNCLALAGEGAWVMAVMTRYRAELGFEHGVEVCRSVATEHLLPFVDRDAGGGAEPNPGRPDLEFS